MVRSSKNDEVGLVSFATSGKGGSGRRGLMGWGAAGADTQKIQGLSLDFRRDAARS